MPDYASSATLTKIGKKMLVFPNYAKKSASTIEKSLADSRQMQTCAYMQIASKRESFETLGLFIG